MSPYPWKWKTSTGVGGGRREGHPSTTTNSLETITPSRALSNETAAVAITDVSYFMAMISFLVQKKKKCPFIAGKIEGVSCSRERGFLLSRRIIIITFSQVITHGS